MSDPEEPGVEPAPTSSEESESAPIPIKVADRLLRRPSKESFRGRTRNDNP
jgi:hypothetical protein